MNGIIAASTLRASGRIQVLPAWWQFLILLAVVVELMAAGYLLRRKWLQHLEVLPLVAALSMWFAMAALYMLIGSALYWSGTPAVRGPLLFWLFVFFVPLCVQYAMNIVSSAAWGFAQRATPMSMAMPGLPATAGDARRHLMQGNVEGGVDLLVQHFNSRTRALAEAARLLCAEERYHAAVPLYSEIIQNYREDRAVWSEAVYSLGKLFEAHLGDQHQAAVLYRRLVDEAPDSRFHLLAGADLARMQVMDSSFFNALPDNKTSHEAHMRLHGFPDSRKPATKEVVAPTTHQQTSARNQGLTQNRGAGKKQTAKKQTTKKPTAKKRGNSALKNRRKKTT